jgi:hypothetical protein
MYTVYITGPSIFDHNKRLIPLSVIFLSDGQCITRKKRSLNWERKWPNPLVYKTCHTKIVALDLFNVVLLVQDFLTNGKRERERERERHCI